MDSNIQSIMIYILNKWNQNHSIAHDYHHLEGCKLYIAIKEALFERSTNTYKTKKEELPKHCTIFSCSLNSKDYLKQLYHEGNSSIYQRKCCCLDDFLESSCTAGASCTHYFWGGMSWGGRHVTHSSHNSSYVLFFSPFYSKHSQTH